MKNLTKTIDFWVKGSFDPKFNSAFKRYARPNALVTFVPEPSNPFDSNAILVMVNGRAIGYVSAGRCKTFLRLMDAGYVAQARIDRLSNNGEMASVTGEFVERSAVPTTITNNTPSLAYLLGRFVRQIMGGK